jgi:hypothetical protein
MPPKQRKSAPQKQQQDANCLARELAVAAQRIIINKCEQSLDHLQTVIEQIKRADVATKTETYRIVFTSRSSSNDVAEQRRIIASHASALLTLNVLRAMCQTRATAATDVRCVLEHNRHLRLQVANARDAPSHVIALYDVPDKSAAWTKSELALLAYRVAQSDQSHGLLKVLLAEPLINGPLVQLGALNGAVFLSAQRNFEFLLTHTSADTLTQHLLPQLNAASFRRLFSVGEQSAVLQAMIDRVGVAVRGAGEQS